MIKRLGNALLRLTRPTDNQHWLRGFEAGQRAAHDSGETPVACAEARGLREERAAVVAVLRSYYGAELKAEASARRFGLPVDCYRGKQAALRDACLVIESGEHRRGEGVRDVD